MAGDGLGLHHEKLPHADLFEAERHLAAQMPEDQRIQVASAESAGSFVQEAGGRRTAEAELQAAVAQFDPRSRLDESTPRDGHCLLHALRAGGLLAGVPEGMTVFQLRALALSTATPEQLETAASSMQPPLSVAEYVTQMRSSQWGDELMLRMLSSVFSRGVCVISASPGAAATFYPDGTRVNAADPSAIWIAHQSEFHYFGVLRGCHDDGLSPDLIYECPLCTPEVICGTCEYQQRKKLARIQDEMPRRLRISCKSAPSTVSSAVVGKLVPEPASSQPKGQPEQKSVCKRPSGKKWDGAAQGSRACGNCGRFGHVATTCTMACFACGGLHKYYECDHPDLHFPAKRQSNRNRVTWEGYGSVSREKKTVSKGMKPSGAGREWIRQDWDPEYTPSGDITPKRAFLTKHEHISDRTRTSLRQLWGMDEEGQITTLIDGGFLTDFCVNENGKDLNCPGCLRLMLSYSRGYAERQLGCQGVPNKHRHKLHWLQGSVFQGHTKLTADDVIGVLHSFASMKNNEATSMDIGLGRKVVGELFDRLRMASCLLAVHHRDATVFEHCQIEVNETVVRKERLYEARGPGEPRKRIGTKHHCIVGLTQRGSTKTVMYMCAPKEVLHTSFTTFCYVSQFLNIFNNF